MQDKEFETLTGMIQQMPQEDPPQGFTDSIIQKLRPKRLSLWARMYRSAFTPRTISFTPGRLIPAAVVVMAFFIFLVHQNFQGVSREDRNGDGLIPVPVTFVFENGNAKEVSVIGSFNGWEPGSHEMRFSPEKNQWVLTVMLPPGQHEYAFLINGERVVPDPKAVFTRSDGFGSKNSVIFTGSHSEIHL